MKPTIQDQQIFDEMKAVFGKIGLQVTDEGQERNYLFFNSRLFRTTPFFENDLAIGYQTKAKMIRIVARIFQPVPQKKRNDLLGLFNHLNLLLHNVRVTIEPSTQFVQLRGEMALFGGPLNRKKFEEVLQLFFTALMKFFPMIEDFLNEEIKKEDFENSIHDEVKAHLEAM